MAEIDEKMQNIIDAFNKIIDDTNEKKSSLDKFSYLMWSACYDVGSLFGKILGAFIFGLKDGFSDEWEEWGE